MILFIIDIIVYNLTYYSSYLMLLNLNKKDNYIKLILISILLDYVILKTYYKLIVIMLILIFLNNYVFKYKRENLVNFLSINIINYILFIVLSNIINFNISYTYISLTIVNNFFMYITCSFVYYIKFINRD